MLGEFAVQQGVKTVAIVDDRTAYGQGLADEFRRRLKFLRPEGRRHRIHQRQGDRLQGHPDQDPSPTQGRTGLLRRHGRADRWPSRWELGIRCQGSLGGDATPVHEAGLRRPRANYCSLPGMPLKSLARVRNSATKFTGSSAPRSSSTPRMSDDAVLEMADSMRRADSVDPPITFRPLADQVRRGDRADPVRCCLATSRAVRSPSTSTGRQARVRRDPGGSGGRDGQEGRRRWSKGLPPRWWGRPARQKQWPSRFRAVKSGAEAVKAQPSQIQRQRSRRSGHGRTERNGTARCCFLYVADNLHKMDIFLQQIINGLVQGSSIYRLSRSATRWSRDHGPDQFRPRRSGDDPARW